ncbi:V-type ATP synthase subunit I domain-containing protein [Chryseobacterium mulctrae]|uniref:hypothetical protein n=1 Tax=Chryseobacterium mulctrae TaxID=2576777 RepID=UPI001117821B|nr:hypothetical protein [Chryseobacterium mulctrae]
MSNINFENLQLSSEKRLEQLMFETDQLHKSLDKIEETEKVFEKINITLEIAGLKDLINYRLFLGIVSMDLCSAILIHSKSKSNYENIYSARQIIVIISEAYKKIYNFIHENKHGDIISRYRNNSYWIKEIGNIIQNELKSLQGEYSEITKDLDEYLKMNFELLQIQRNLSIHYDKDSTKVYKMLIELDVEEIFKTLIPFINILNKMFEFTDKLRDAYKFKSDSETEKVNHNFEKLALDLDRFKDKDSITLIEDIQTIIRQMK